MNWVNSLLDKSLRSLGYEKAAAAPRTLRRGVPVGRDGAQPLVEKGRAASCQRGARQRRAEGVAVLSVGAGIFREDRGQSVRRADYDSVRPQIRHGDVIAFGGEGFYSGLIKLATNSPVSHVGVVYRAAPDPRTGLWQNLLMESTSLSGFSGVTLTRLSSRLQDYRGEVWWLALSDEFRHRTDWQAFHVWLALNEGKPYDARAAATSALDRAEKLPLIGKLFRNPERYKRLFCSQLVCGAFKAAGALPKTLNPAEITPRDLAAMKIYSGAAQLKGAAKDIKNFNTLEPESLG